MSDLLPLARPRPDGHPVHVRYEKAGLSLSGPPVPWCADAVVVEVVLRLPPTARQRTDFTLRIPGREAVPAETVRKDAADDSLFRVFFRLPPLPGTATAEVLWKQRLLTSVALPVRTADQYLSEMVVATPTVSVRLGDRSVAATTFVAAQCRGLTAAAVLRSPSGLAPLADLGVAVAFRAERTGTEHVVPVPLSASQLAATEALVTAAPPKCPRHTGEYRVTWRVADRPLSAQRVSAVSAARFAESLRVSDARFVVADEPGGVKAARQPPAAGGATPVGPCFVLASREPGAAGLVELDVLGVGPGPARPGPLLTQTVLVTDGPTVFAPGLLGPDDTANLSGFEVRHKGRTVGTLSFRPVPTAAFDSEGGFKPPPDFSWSNAADEELTERMLRLMRGDNPG